MMEARKTQSIVGASRKYTWESLATSRERAEHTRVLYVAYTLHRIYIRSTPVRSCTNHRVPYYHKFQPVLALLAVTIIIVNVAQPGANVFLAMLSAHSPRVLVSLHVYNLFVLIAASVLRLSSFGTFVRSCVRIPHSSDLHL